MLGIRHTRAELNWLFFKKLEDHEAAKTLPPQQKPPLNQKHRRHHLEEAVLLQLLSQLHT